MENELSIISKLIVYELAIITASQSAGTLLRFINYYHDIIDIEPVYLKCIEWDYHAQVENICIYNQYK
jgi:hypothetical protein